MFGAQSLSKMYTHMAGEGDNEDMANLGTILDIFSRKIGMSEVVKSSDFFLKFCCWKFCF